ncbi:hypothetical protein PtB15_11B329 [Puccinia triticina]|nr:hypothetical protein PtB15_11B329 [Puccinia triticina]
MALQQPSTTISPCALRWRERARLESSALAFNYIEIEAKVRGATNQDSWLTPADPFLRVIHTLLESH